ncbi:MAG: hypothetical protein IJO77_04550, partial [Oscillospiraceae bacterium]|nr:hypothetical protein [Oscillospiraceae bacterium]
MRHKRHTTRRKDAIPIKLFGNTGKKKPKNNTSAPADTTVSTPAPEVNTEKPEINAEKTPAPKKKSGKVGIIIGIVVVVIIAAAAAGIFAVDRIDTVYPGVTVNDIDISGMTEEEAAAAISALDISATVTFPTGDSFTVTAVDAGVPIDSDTIIGTAMAHGRGGNIFTNAIAYITSGTNPVDILDELKTDIDPEAVKALVAPHVDAYNEEVNGELYTIEGD